MSSPPDTDPTEAAPRPWRRWLPLAIGVAAVIAVIVVIAVVSGGDDSTTGDTASSGGQTVAPSGSPATIETSAAPATTAAPSTSASDTAGPTTSAAGSPTTSSSPSSTASSPVTTSPTASTVATTLPATAPQIDLGRAADFAILGNTKVESTGPTQVIGQIGTSNGVTTGLSATDNPAGVIIVDSPTALQAQQAVDDAASVLDGRAPTELPAAELGGVTLGAGTYSSATLGLTGTVTLDGGGDPNALFVFQSPGTLTIAAAGEVVLAGGAQACNVFWRLGSSATLGSGSTLVGTVIADDSVTAASGSDVTGRLIARNGAVTLDSDSITLSVCA